MRPGRSSTQQKQWNVQRNVKATVPDNQEDCDTREGGKSNRKPNVQANQKKRVRPQDHRNDLLKRTEGYLKHWPVLGLVTLVRWTRLGSYPS